MADFTNEVLFIIVLFRRSLADAPAWTSLNAEISNRNSEPLVLVYDNSVSPQSPPITPKIKIHYHHDPVNSGVSTAYNFGCRLAALHEKKWLFLLDQDTHLPAGTLQQYELSLLDSDAVLFAPTLRDHVGLVSPFSFRHGRGRRLQQTPSSPFPLKELRACNSGILVLRSAFEQAGGYEKDIPLDFSDLAFQEKLNPYGAHCRLVDITLQHNFSGSESLPKIEALARFRFFCQGALGMGKLAGRMNAFRFQMIQRATQLSLRYRDLQFLQIAFDFLKSP